MHYWLVIIRVTMKLCLRGMPTKTFNIHEIQVCKQQQAIQLTTTSAMHNIIASERSGVECARDEIYAHCYYAYLELRRTLRWYAAPVEIEIYIYIAKNRALDTTRSARSQLMFMPITWLC